MLIGFGYNGFEQLKETNERYISTPVPIAMHCGGASVVNNTSKFQIILGWSSIHVLTGEHIFCSKRICKCPFSNLLKAPCIDNLMSIIDASYYGNAALIITKERRCLVLDKDSAPKEINALEVNCDKLQSVCVGDTHTMAITDNGLCGKIVLSDSSYHFKALPLAKVCQVTCGKEHVLFLTQSGEIHSYGFGSRGQLGHGRTDAEKTPRIVEALQGIKMSAISCGGWHSAALSGIGDVYIWGWNESGQLGLPMKSKSNFKEKYKKLNIDQNKISKQRGTDRQYEAAEIEHDRQLGKLNRQNDEDSLSGMNDKIASCSADIETSKDVAILFAMQPCLLDFPNDINVSKVSCGSRHSAAVLENGKLYTWGWGKYGQLGHGNLLTLDQPTLVQGLQHQQVTDVTCGAWSTVALCESAPSGPDQEQIFVHNMTTVTSV